MLFSKTFHSSMLISIVVPTFCEETTLEMHYRKCLYAIQELRLQCSEEIGYEYIVIDNCSPDNTVRVARSLRDEDCNVKIYVNRKNYGPVLSPFEGLMKSQGDLVLLIAADLQEPPEMLVDFYHGIQGEHDACIGYKASSSDTKLMWITRGAYYRLMKLLRLTSLPYRYGGFGLYRRELIESLRHNQTDEPSMRILVPRYARSINAKPYEHRCRAGGKSTYSIYTYTREALKNVTLNTSTFQHIAAKIALVLSFLAIIAIPVSIVIKISMWSALGPVITSLIVLVLFMSSITMAFIAIILERLERILQRLPARRNGVEFKMIYS